MSAPGERPARVRVDPATCFVMPDDPLAFAIEAHSRRWTDGLPVIPPTPERVEAMIAAVGRDRHEPIAVLAPRSGVASVEAVAVNAVLAGCEPRHFPIVLAAVEAVARPEFNLAAINATTHPVPVRPLVSPPATKAAAVHSGSGVFGPGFRANACIGRALRFVQFSIAGAWPGDGDLATMGSPAKIAFCIAERTDASPWPGYHESIGLSQHAHAVTVFPAESPVNIQDHASTTADGLLSTIACSMSLPGSNNVLAPHRGHPILALGVEHADTIASSGWDRQDVQRFLAEHATFPSRLLGDAFLSSIKPLNKPLPDLLPIVLEPDQIQIVVTGGIGKHSMFLPTFGLAVEATVEWSATGEG
jgi:hypothetical protein